MHQDNTQIEQLLEVDCIKLYLHDTVLHLRSKSNLLSIIYISYKFDIDLKMNAMLEYNAKIIKVSVVKDFR